MTVKGSHGNVLKKVENRVNELDSTLNSFDGLKISLNKLEQESYKLALKEMNDLKAKILNDLQAKKINVINEIHQFYPSKIELVLKLKH